MIIATLGSLSISLQALEGRSSGKAWSYAEHALIEGKPVLQWVGDQLETQTLNLRFSAHFSDPQAELDAWQVEADKHQALPFVLAEGRVLGSFVIEEISENPQKTFQDGHLMEVAITVKLKEAVSSSVNTQVSPPQAPVRVRRG